MAAEPRSTHVDTEDWEYDDETGGLVHMIHTSGSVEVGLWKAGPRADETIDVDLEADETFLVLAGSGRIAVDGAAPLELRPGDIVTVPKGAHTSWVVDEAFRELWIYG